VKQFGNRYQFRSQCRRRAAYKIEPVAPSAVKHDRRPWRRRAMKGWSHRTADKLGANASERSTRHIEVQTPSDITYRVGDHLSVVPRNDPALVDSVARRFGFLPGRSDPAAGPRKAAARNCRSATTVSVGRLLSEFVELQQVATRTQIQIMSEHTRLSGYKPKLMAYVGADAAASEHYRSDILSKRKSVFDLLEEHPACELPFHVYLEMLSLLAPRYYSISSSPFGDPSRCSVTVAVVEGPAGSGRGVYKGICSNYLAGRRAGEMIHATCAKPRPASDCRMTLPCRSSWSDLEPVLRHYAASCRSAPR